MFGDFPANQIFIHKLKIQIVESLLVYTSELCFMCDMNLAE